MSTLDDFPRWLWERTVVVTNRRLCQVDFFARLEDVLSRRPHLIILREKDLEARRYRELAKRAAELCACYRVPLVLNGFAEAAQWRLLEKRRGFMGLQLGLCALKNLRAAGKLLPRDIDLGVSIHAAEEAAEAEALGADWLVAGHVFKTGCKPDAPPRGLDFLRETVQAARVPVYAIGGLDENNAEKALCCGASAVCMMSRMMR